MQPSRCFAKQPNVDDPFQMALLDFSLAGMNGEELGQRIAGDPQLHQTALVLMTGFERRKDGGRALGRDFSAHVSKPIWERTLQEALLPLEAKGNRPISPAQHASRHPAPLRTNGQKRILVVEDNPTNQQVAVAILKKLGYHADLAAQGVEALRLLHEADYDLVLMDCEMPVMDGYAATRLIRGERTATRNPHLPIIALTADAMCGDRDKCLQAGMSDYLVKPIEPQQLADLLEKWLVTPPGGKVQPFLSQPPQGTQAVFNQAELLHRLAGDKDLAHRIIAGFLDDVPRQLRLLNNQLAAGDARGVQQQAHTLKGAAASISAEALRAICSEVQEAAVARELNRAASLLPRLQEQFGLLKATLKQRGFG